MDNLITYVTLVENILGLVRDDTIGLEHTPRRQRSAKNDEIQFLVVLLCMGLKYIFNDSAVTARMK